MILSHDELGVIFSYLEPVQNIPTLNLVCRQWYEASSLTSGVNTALWQQWYEYALTYYAKQIKKSYRRKWLLKKKNKISNRSHRTLLYGLISTSQYLTKNKTKVRIERLIRGNNSSFNIETNVLSYIERAHSLFRADPEKFTAELQTSAGKNYFARIISRICFLWTRQISIALFTLMDEAKASLHETTLLPNVWMLGFDLAVIPGDLLLPTQVLILYGNYEDARSLHEKYGCPLSVQINENVTITSTDVLLCGCSILQRHPNINSVNYQRFNNHYSEDVKMLEWLLEKEGFPSVVYDLTLPSLEIVNGNCTTTPIACLVKQFSESSCVPLVKLLIERGEDVKRGDSQGVTPVEVLCEYCEKEVEFSWNWTTFPVKVAKRSEVVHKDLVKLVELLHEYDAEKFVELKNRFISIQLRLVKSARDVSKLNDCAFQ